MKRSSILARITVDRKIVEMFREGHSASAIAGVFEKGKGYVIKTRDLAEQYGYIEKISDEPKIYRSTPRVMPAFPEALFPLTDLRKSKPIETDNLLDPQRQWIVERLELGWSPQTIFEEILVSLPRSNFYRYLSRHELRKRGVLHGLPEIIHLPGECLQVDWAKVFDVSLNGRKQTVWAFIGILGHSRYALVRVMIRCDFAATVEAIESMLVALGGVPRKITSDNPKVFVNLASKHEPVLNAAYERFASHYGFIIEALPPSDPKKKGKVERSVQWVRRLYESFDQTDFSIEKAQAHIERKLEIFNLRRHGSHNEQPTEVFRRDEREKLKALPLLPYEIETIVMALVRADGFVRFINKYYGVDKRLKGQEATVIGNETKVSIYCGGRLLEVYDRIRDNFTNFVSKDHYKESWERQLQDHGHYIKQAEVIGQNVSRFIQIILARGQGFVDTRIVWGLLTLVKKHKPQDIDRACVSAIELGQVNLKTIHALLSLAPKSKSIDENYNTTGGKFQRSMSEYRAHLRLVEETT